MVQAEQAAVNFVDHPLVRNSELFDGFLRIKVEIKSLRELTPIGNVVKGCGKQQWLRVDIFLRYLE